MMWPGLPTSFSGRLTITDTDDPSGGLLVTGRNGKRTGVYFDDTCPDLRTRVQTALAEKNGLVFVCVPMGRPYQQWPGCVRLWEYYPVNSGFPDPVVVPSKLDGVIVQRAYPGYLWDLEPKLRPTLRAPTVGQYARALLRVMRARPRYIFEF